MISFWPYSLKFYDLITGFVVAIRQSMIKQFNFEFEVDFEYCYLLKTFAVN